MASYPPPTNTTSIYNNQNFSSSTDSSNYALINKSNTFTANQFCSASINANASESQLVTKGYIDTLSFPTINGNNVWTGENSYNTNLPTSNLLPSSSTQLVTKNYTDSNFAQLGQANTFTSTNNFNNLPTSSQVPTTSNELITKSYGDSTYSSLAGDNNFIATNNFSNMPTCSQTPSTSNQLVNVAYVQNYVNGTVINDTVSLDTNQTITGQKTFTQTVLCTATMPPANDSSTDLATTQWVQSAIQNQNNLIGSFAFTYIADGSKPTGLYLYNTYPSSSIITSYSRASTGTYIFNFSQQFGASVKAVYPVAFSGSTNYGFMNCCSQLVAENFSNSPMMSGWTTQVSSYGSANSVNQMYVWVWGGGSDPQLSDLPYNASQSQGGYVIVKIYAQ